MVEVHIHGMNLALHAAPQSQNKQDRQTDTHTHTHGGSKGKHLFKAKPETSSTNKLNNVPKCTARSATNS